MRMDRKRLIIGFTTLIIAVGITGYAFIFPISDEPVNGAAIRDQQKRAASPYNRKMVDSGIHLLRTGDLVLRTGADITSFMFSQMNPREKTYSHCGIVIIEHGYPFIYHSIGGEDNPDQVLKRDSASFWFSPANNLGYGIARYTFDSLQVDALTKTVYRYAREKRKFDMDFDLRTDDRLYCAEFAYKAINQAVKDSGFISPVTLFGYRFVSVDNLFLCTHASLICQVRYK